MHFFLCWWNSNNPGVTNMENIERFMVQTEEDREDVKKSRPKR